MVYNQFTSGCEDIKKKNTAYDDLELEAQFNVDADKYAAKGKLRPIVSLLPSCDAMLSIRGISVTSNYRKQLIRD
jgi:hypothetical protein